MVKKIIRSEQGSIDPIEQIESLHDVITRAREGSPPISFIDSLALTSLTKTLEYIDMSVQIDGLDYRTRFFISEIRNFADSIALRLSTSLDTQSRLNYIYPITYPLACVTPSTDNDDDADIRYDWIISNLEQIETAGELPDDIDSTWSALYGLAMHSWQDQAVPSRIFANCLKNLESVRQAESLHIFNTWLVDNVDDDSEWKSTDIVAMSSVTAFFDWLDPHHLPKTRSFIFNMLIAYLRNPIESLWFSDFYHSLPLAIYLISRCAWSTEQIADLSSHLIQILHAADDESADFRIRIENSTDACLYLASLMRLHHQDDRTCEISEFHLLTESCMETDPIGTTISDPLYIHSLRGNKTAYAMSSVISSLIMFESVFGMMHFMKKEKAEQGIIVPITSTAPILSPYSGAAASLTDKISETLRSFEVLKDKSEIVERLISGTDFCICLEICLAMFPDDIQSAEDALTAHALGLCTYFLYDKIYDQELSPNALPILFLTNAVFQTQLRHFMDGLDALCIDIPLQVQSIIADTDISYYVLAERGKDAPLFIHSIKSMGTSIIPILCMLKAGVSAEATKCVQEFFGHFNLARQISDDAKDADRDESVALPKVTTMSILCSQKSIEYAIFRETLGAKNALDSIVRIAALLQDGCDADNRLRSVYCILRKHLDEFLIKALRAKWELAVIRDL